MHYEWKRGIMEALTRRKAAWGLLAVTFAWGATFIWMKQAMNAIQPEIEAYGRTPVVATLVGGRFLIAFMALFIAFMAFIAFIAAMARRSMCGSKMSTGVNSLRAHVTVV